VTPEELRSALEPTHNAIRDCADGIGQLLSSVEKLVLAVGVQEKGEPSLAMQLRDVRERLGRIEESLGRVEEVAAGARDASDRTHRLLLNESDELGAKDQSMQAQIEQIGERLDGFAQRESQRAGAKP
jgi:hypothetical protein